MPTPYLPQDLFKLNPELSITVEEIDGLGPVVIVDDFYQYATDIEHILSRAWVPSFKYMKGTRNFIDYYDCRLNIVTTPNDDEYYMQSQRFIFNAISKYFDVTPEDKELDYHFNFFKWINVPESSDIQLYPHRDSFRNMASVIYLNNTSHKHGTAFYTKSDISHDDIDMRVNIKESAELVKVIDAKFNRCIIYPGWYTHGAYIYNHKDFTGKCWRYNQVYFIKVKHNE